MTSFALRVQCESRRGIVAAISTFLSEQGCNITDSAQFDDAETGNFFMRTSFRSEHGLGLEELRKALAPIAKELDEGPIIEQDTIRVTHAQSPEDYVSLGRDVEAQVFAKAIHAHVRGRVFLNGNKTVVFPPSPGSYASERMG